MNSNVYSNSLSNYKPFLSNSNSGLASRITGRFFFYVYIVLFSILPSYTKALGNPIYRLASIGIFLMIVFLNYRKIKRVDFWFVLFFLLYSIPKLFSFVFNNEFDRILVFIIEFVLPFYTIAFVFRHDKITLLKTIDIVVFTCLVLCVFGLIEEITQFNVFSLIENYQFENPHINSGSTFRWGIYRIEQGFNTPLTYALFLLLGFGLTFYKWRTTHKNLYFFIMVLEGINLVLTVSRGIIVLFLAYLVLMFLIVKKKKGMKSSILPILTVAFLLLTLLVISAQDFFEKIVGSTFNMVFTGSDSDAYGDSSLALRNGFQGYALSLLQNTNVLIFGVGQYGLRELTTIDNDWLLELVTYGLPGLIGFICLFMYALIPNFRTLIRNKPDYVSKTFSKCAIITILFYAVSLFTVAQMEDVRLFIIVISIATYYPFKCSAEKALV